MTRAKADDSVATPRRFSDGPGSRFLQPGISRYFVASVIARDYTVVMGVTIVLAVLIVCINLVVDIAHRALDPRLQEA